MKKVLVFFTLMIIQMACQDDTKQLLNTIDGRWQVNTVTYTSRTGRDSVATLKSTHLNFDRCTKTANQSGPSSCSVEYMIDNQKFAFTYQAPDGGKSLYISPTSQMNDPAYKQIAELVSGGYEVITLTGQLLVIRRPLQGTTPGYEFIQYSATK